jgi:hypothetical protein
MIAIRLNGGLGNQLFQYATARSVAFRIHELPYLDLSLLLQKDSRRTYQLDHFKIEAITNKSYLKRLWFHNFTKKKLAFFIENPLKQHRFPYDNILLEGYWQNHFYFDHLRELLREEIVPRKSFPMPWLANIKTSQSVAIHIRRGDYVDHPLHEVCTEKYYFKAIESVRSKINNPVFFVFSDDMEYARSLFIQEKDFVFVNEKETIPAFWMMKNCRHFILSNSSFSWWAQYLSADNNIVIAPARWFNDNQVLSTGIYFRHWEIIEGL